MLVQDKETDNWVHTFFKDIGTQGREKGLSDPID